MPVWLLSIPEIRFSTGSRISIVRYVYQTCRRTPVSMPLEEHLGWKPDLEKLENQDLSKVKMMWVNYPNMPTGATADIRFFNQLVAFAKEITS